MKSMKLMGLTFLAIFALGAFAAVSAAEEGFLKPEEGTPPLANILGGKSVLASAGGTSIECEKLDELHLEFTNDKHATATLHWLGCKAAGLFSANSLGDKAGEILVPVLFLVCLNPKNSGGTVVDEFGIAGEASNVHLEVPSVGTLVVVNGTALAAVLTKGTAELWNVEFLGEKGKQTVTECSEGANIKKHTLTSETNENKKPEAASENVVGGLIQFDKPVVLMDK